ncbi:MAG: hypothetical protein K9K75_04035 [Deltaproteobacteria bacterium]|nr:hypothetical protein [Deltaproteobacteria bacterium]
MKFLSQYAQTILNVLAIVGIIETIVLILGIGYAGFLWFRGILPAVLRLGNGLTKRKIAIFAKGDNVNSLKSLLSDSGLFREKNVFEITQKGDLGKAEKASVYLVYWHDWSADIEKILDMKPDSCALIIYAPYDKGRIPDEQMKNLDGKRHSAVTNFRGRLLNDIVTAMITTSYDR